MGKREELLKKWCEFCSISRKTYFNWKKKHPLLILLIEQIFHDEKSVEYFIDKWKDYNLSDINDEMTSQYVHAAAKFLSIEISNFYKFRQNEKRKYIIKLIILNFSSSDEIYHYINHLELKNTKSNEYLIYEQIGKLSHYFSINLKEQPNLHELKKIKDFEIILDLVFNQKGEKEEILKVLVNSFFFNYEDTIALVNIIFEIKNAVYNYICKFPLHICKYKLFMSSHFNMINLRKFSNNEKNTIILFFIYLAYKSEKNGNRWLKKQHGVYDSFLIYQYISVVITDKNQSPTKFLNNIFKNVGKRIQFVNINNQENSIHDEINLQLHKLQLAMINSNELKTLISK